MKLKRYLLCVTAGTSAVDRTGSFLFSILTEKKEKKMINIVTDFHCYD